MKKSIQISVILVIAATMLFVGCGKPASKTVKIGVFEPITGANAAGGSLEVDGVKLANEMYPEVLGKKVELVIVDNKSDKTEAANAAARLAQKEKVVAVIGSWGSSLSMAGGPVFADSKIPAVGASCTNPLVTKGNDFYFRVCFIDPFQGTVMANYAFSNVKAKKVAIVQEVSNDYSVGLAKFFTDAFVKLTNDPKSIVSVSNYNTGDQDFTAQLTNIKAQKPDAIFAPGNYTESALIVKQARQLGIKAPFLGGDTWETPDFIDVGKEAVEGVVFSTFFATEVPITDTSKDFLKAYRDKNAGKDPAAVTALGFDAYLVILDAIKRANSLDTVKIKEEIAKTTKFPGAAGFITLDQDHNAVKSAVIKTVKGGKFTYLTTIEPNVQ
jgi:branched-chain amino acid transport system substrate-binding protein